MPWLCSDHSPGTGACWPAHAVQNQGVQSLGASGLKYLVCSEDVSTEHNLGLRGGLPVLLVEVEVKPTTACVVSRVASWVEELK